MHGTARHVGKTLQDKEERPHFNMIAQYRGHVTNDDKMYTSIFSFIFMPHSLCHKQIMCEQKHNKHKSGKTKINYAQTKVLIPEVPSPWTSKGQSMEPVWKNPGVLDLFFPG